MELKKFKVLRGQLRRKLIRKKPNFNWTLGGALRIAYFEGRHLEREQGTRGIV